MAQSIPFVFKKAYMYVCISTKYFWKESQGSYHCGCLCGMGLGRFYILFYLFLSVNFKWWGGEVGKKSINKNLGVQTCKPSQQQDPAINLLIGHLSRKHIHHFGWSLLSRCGLWDSSLAMGGGGRPGGRSI